jgi:hypothetical protein
MSIRVNGDVPAATCPRTSYPRRTPAGVRRKSNRERLPEYLRIHVGKHADGSEHENARTSAR